MLLGGLALGAALLSKPFGAAVAGPVAVAWVVVLLRRSDRRPGVLAKEVAAAAGGVLATYGLWLVVVAVVGGYPSTAEGAAPMPGEGRAVSRLRAPADPRHAQPAAHPGLPAALGRLLLARHAAARAGFDGVRWVLVVVTVASAAWAVLALVDLVRVRRGPRPAGRRRGRPAGRRHRVALSAVVATWLVLWAAGYWYFRSTGANSLLQGRYALLCVPALLALPVLLLRRGVPRCPRARRRRCSCSGRGRCR